MDNPGTLPTHEEMDKAFRARDARYDGIFYAAVTSTGIFCKPSCPARKPLADHIEYYATPREALFAGFRPCKRCRPMEAGVQAPEWVRALLAKVDGAPEQRLRDEDVRSLGIEPAAARRWFKKNYGITFQAYSRARRLGRAFDALRKGGSLDDAALDYGWGSFSGFRDAFGKAFGSPPGAISEAKAGGDFVRLGWIETPMGPMIAGASEDGLCLLEFSDRRMLEAQLVTLRSRFRMPLVPSESPVFSQLRDELGAYFSGSSRSFSVPIALKGSEFQERVWRGLLAIPYGETRTYAGLAADLGLSGAARAVGHANGLNRMAIVVPCHRVVNADGSPGGYGGGLWRKRALLDLEKGLRRFP